jgi:UDP-N-acetylmuramoyl-tripeptide--D-alanyl-D-alanine ligase
MSPARSRTVEFADGWTLFDDTYNSNPEALRKTVDTIARSEGFTRRIVVLGDMLELGENEVEEHLEAGRFIAGAGFDVLITLGPLAEKMAEGALEAGMSPDAVTTAADSATVVEAVDELLREGDLVLIKGSRGVKMETIVEELTRRHEVTVGAGGERGEA